MIKASFVLGYDEMDCEGETPSEVFLQLERIQDFDCLVMQASMFGHADAADELLNNYVNPARWGELTFDVLKNLNIDFGIGKAQCMAIEQLF